MIGATLLWANNGSNSIGKATLDASGGLVAGSVNHSFVSGGGLANPTAVAADSAHIYWTDNSHVGRANIDGSSPNASFIADFGTKSVMVGPGIDYTLSVNRNNLALRTTAVTLSPTHERNATTENASKAVDGDPSTQWVADAPNGASAVKSMTVDLGRTRSISRVGVRHAGSSGQAVARNTRDFTISSSSDASTWTPRAVVTNNTASVSTHTLDLGAPVDARYVRLDVSWATGITDNPDVNVQNGTVRIHELEVYGTGTGVGTGTISSSPSGIDCGVTCALDFTPTSLLTVTAIPATGSTFAGWSGACSGTGACSVTMDAAKYVNANFGATRALATATSGTGTGTVTCDGGTCASSYADGTDVTLHATPDAGSYFDGWTGDCSGVGDCTVSMTGPKIAVAVFNAIPAACSEPGAITGDASVSTITGTEDSDVICSLGGGHEIVGLGGNDLIYPGLGDDTVDGGFDADTISYANTDQGVAIDLLSATDDLSNLENLTGTDADDTLSGDNTTNVITGLDGSDAISGHGGRDTVLPGLGDDIDVDGGTGNDTISYRDMTGGGVEIDLDAGTATGAGSDAFSGFESAEGTDGNDTLSGTDGRNILKGGDGADHLLGLGGDDELVPGLGDDPEVDGGTGKDVLTYADITASGVTVELPANEASGGGGDDTLASIERVKATNHDDTLVGNNDPNTLVAYAGEDHLFGLGGQDELSPGLGNDDVDGGDGTDTLTYASIGSGVTVDLSATEPFASGGGGDDALTSIERVKGTNTDDILTGDDNPNRLSGYGGEDNLLGGGGADLLTPGLGNDPEVDGGDGNDTVNYADINALGVIVDLGAGTASGGGGFDGLTSIERITATNQHDDLTGSTDTNVIKGLGDDDDIDVTDNLPKDVADGGGGDDTCTGDSEDIFRSC